MNTCVRGFSFMPETTLTEMKFVEPEELEQAWKTTRRERIKQREQKIWEEFVQEQDVVSSVCQDDPYQFIDQLPAATLNELLEAELKKMKQEIAQEQEQVEEPVIATSPSPPPVENQHMVTFVDDSDKEDYEAFHISDDKEDVSGAEGEGEGEGVCGDSPGGSPPLTVRARTTGDAQDIAPAPPAVSPPHSADKTSNKSTENVTSMIESSIYCARIKDTRIKIKEELLETVAFLERHGIIINIDPAEIPKMTKRAVEFSARFNRIHLYQLQRQTYDLRRHAAAPAFGAHTHLQAQLARALALHAALLHAAQAFNKSLSQTMCLRDSAPLLRALLAAARDAAAETPPAALANAEDMEDTYRKVEETLDDYTTKMSEYLHNVEKMSLPYSRTTNKMKGRKKTVDMYSKGGSKLSAESAARLSMYSADTLRSASKPRSIKELPSSGTSKMNASINSRDNQSQKVESPSKNQKKTPRCRRPLMRSARGAGGGRGARTPRGDDIHTLVETVTCTSSHISREATPRTSPRGRRETPRFTKESTPRTPRISRDFASTSTNRLSLSPKPKPTPRLQVPKNSPRVGPTREEQELAETKKEIFKNKDVSKEKQVVKEKGDDKSVKERGEARIIKQSPREEKKTDQDRNKGTEFGPTSYEVTRLLQQLCGGDSGSSRYERVTGSKNAQLLCVSGSSPRQPSTPQLLKILEETIQKKTPKTLFPKQLLSAKEAEKCRMLFNIPQKVTDRLFQYRTKFVQHMLTSSMYANSAVGKPWEMIGSVSEKIIDYLLLNCVKEMELGDVIKQLFKSEIR